MKLTPLIFTPKLLPKIWGGRRLGRFGRVVPAGELIGESWDLYDRPGDSALVDNGIFQGQRLNDLMKEHGPALLGPKAFDSNPAFFPLMFKLIDADDALSVQVHPDDAQAASMVGPDEPGKTEIWVVLEAKQGATMTAGLKPGTTRQDFAAAVAEGRLEGLLNTFTVKAGDVIDVPAGRVHAIGKGCLVAELQQNSDTTYRVYDYGRLENGKARELHIEQALRCVRFDAALEGMPALVAPQDEGGGVELLLEGPYFKVSRFKGAGPFQLRVSEPSYQILSCLEGEAILKYDGGSTPLKKGDTALIPACLGAATLGAGLGAAFLWSRP